MNKMYYYLYDANGNVGQMIDAADGSLTSHYEYDPYGNITVKTGSYADANPYRFSSKYFDSEIDLLYYGYRYYDAKLGRWINRDPLEEDGGFNLYAFVGNAPINCFDILGLKTLDEIEKQYRKIILGARLKGYNVAADNLEHFLGATGTKRTLDWQWLRQFDKVLAAERVNRERFMNKTLLNMIKKFNLKDMEVLDWWDSQQTAGMGTELFYASGTFTVTSYGKFKLTCGKEGKVKVAGSVDHYWWDPYDWHADLFAFIPGFGTVSDKDALALQIAGRAAPFLMDSIWNEEVEGEVDKMKLNILDLKWTGPFGGSSGAMAAVLAKYPKAVPKGLNP